MDYKSIEDKGYILPVANLTIDFIKPAKYDEVLTVKTILKDKPAIRVDFYYEVYNAENELVCKAKSRLVFANKETGKPCRPFPEFIRLVNQYFQ